MVSQSDKQHKFEVFMLHVSVFDRMKVVSDHLKKNISIFHVASSQFSRKIQLRTSEKNFSHFLKKQLNITAKINGYLLRYRTRNSFSWHPTVLWTDSTTVLQWIRGAEKRQQIFVANRVAEILDNTNVRQWRHCSGELNPADDGTRGLPLKDFSSACRWFSGPQFQQPEHRWPVDHSFSGIEEVQCKAPTAVLQ